MIITITSPRSRTRCRCGRRICLRLSIRVRSIGAKGRKMLEAPIGFTRLNDVVDLLRGAAPTGTDLQRLIATACVQGKLVAAHRRWDGGADKLDNRVWQLPHWRSYFESGTIRLELPL